ncbi:MAG: SurA N-terminal domain-containing protein [Pseudomonadota bacterium]
MLLAIRERVMGLVGWVLLGILAIAFSFFGLNWYFQTDSRVFAASVNDVNISLSEQQRGYQLLRAQLQDRLGQSYDPALIDEDRLKKNALEQLIREQLLLQEAEAAGFAISPQLVAARISQIDGFRDDGNFSKKRYERVLRLQGMSPAEFEWRLSREMMIRQIINGISQTAAMTTAGTDTAYRLQAQQRRFSYITIPLDRFTDKVEISDEDINAYYENNSSQFMTPERIRVQYLELKAENIEVLDEIDEDSLRQLYDEQAERYITPEERKARHILVRSLPDDDEAAIASAREKAAALLKRLDDGESFEELAKAESDDPGSAANGGDLGFFGKGLMAAEFEQATFALEKGARSDIVRSPFGFHIIEVTDIHPEVVKPFEEVRAELVADYLAEQRSEQFYELSETLANLVFEQPDSLQGAADALGLEVQSSDWITAAGGTGIGEYPGVVAMAFQDDVLQGGTNSEPIEISEEHFIVIRNMEYEPAATRPLDEVREEVSQRLLDSKTRELVRAHGDALLAELRTGKSLADIAGSEELEVADSGLIQRQSPTPDRLLVRQAFLMPAPAENAVTTTGVTQPSGDYVLLSLLEVQQGDTAELTDAERSRFRQELARIQGVSETAAVVDNLRAKATIIIPEQTN